MDDLIEALQIFRKYIDKDSFNYEYPTHCVHDVLTVCVDPRDVSEEDTKRLDELGFFTSDEECFQSFKYGSC